ncbi:MAG: hypothetical protein K0R65_1785 [Crocinitomicaceae bacterium]|nr:hypothetical protein [Crocinitomicaceae bacterium]
MNTAKLFLCVFALIFAASCGIFRKDKGTVTTTTKPENGVYEPGQEELKAVKSQFKDATMAELKEGYALYAQGACTKCHTPKNIYKREVSEWPGIIDRMAEKAKITADEKDAVHKYVMAIKASQPKE